MPLPSLVNYATENEYREHFERTYCAAPITTFDGIDVRFRKRHFDHAFFKSDRNGTKTGTFAQDRAERIDWIKAALQDPGSERYVGWDNVRKQEANDRRVTLINGDYVVVIALKKAGAEFVTAYVATGQTATLIRQHTPV